jgi:hypothetical protein
MVLETKAGNASKWGMQMFQKFNITNNINGTTAPSDILNDTLNGALFGQAQNLPSSKPTMSTF